MTEIYYDCEFLENGRTIDLISIGMVREDGAEYYAVNQDCDLWEIQNHEWLMANVVPSLPLRMDHDLKMGTLVWDYEDPGYRNVRRHYAIARGVRDFILAAPAPELWADYGAYDHVVLCQLWGRMIDLPEGVPMWTHDLRQEAERPGSPALPSLSGITEHNALDDAREVRFRRQWLREHTA